MEAVTAGVVDQAVGGCFALATTQIKKVLSYIRRYHGNINDLRSKHHDLEILKKEVEEKVQDGERKLETTIPFVDCCLKDVEAFLAQDEWNDFMDEDKIGENDRCCFGLVRMNLKYRYLVSKRAAEKCRITKEKFVKMKDCSSRAITLPREPSKLGSTPTAYSKSLASRESTLKEIMGALKDKEVGIIGIYGMGGVGKTTLIEEVARRVEVDGSFSKVIIVEVSQTPYVLKMQQQIAERIGLPLQDLKSADERARKIHERLKQLNLKGKEKHDLEESAGECPELMLAKEGKKVVVMLDNIWKKVDLDRVGIPHNCKVALTTRSELVCHEMGTDKKFEVQGLNDIEATKLFLERAGCLADHDDRYKSVTSELVKKCGGLPLAIVALADTLRNRNLSVWQRAADQLGGTVSTMVGGPMEENVYPIMEWSYNFISNEEKKKFFLLCCLFPLGSSIAVQDLMRYGAGLGLFQYMNSLDEAIEQAYSWATELKSSSLLLEAEDEHHVNIHDIVRAASMSIAIKGGNIFQVGSFPRWLMKETFQTYTAISMTFADNHESLSRFEFPKLEMLLLKGSRPFEFSDDFFQGMKNLRVLVISEMKFLTLPSSITQLKNLRTLHLECCELSDIFAITSLVDLLFLSLRKSIIDELPKEFENLVHLKVLDLTGCSILRKIPADIIARLTELEGLYMMMHRFERWENLDNYKCYNDDYGRDIEEKGASLIELKSLSYLTVLEMHVPSIHLLPDNLLFPHLSRFLISIGNKPANCFFSSLDGNFVKTSQWESYSQILHLEDINANRPLKQSINCLLKDTECLILNKIIGLTNVTDSLVNDGFRNLKNLYVADCSDIEYIASTNELNEDGAFPKLEVLYARDMSKLKGIYHGPNLYDSFHHLKKLYLRNIKFVRSFWDNHDVQNSRPFFDEKMKFPSLEELTIINLRGIVELWHLANVEDEFPAFPKLVSLQLKLLPELRSIWSKDVILHHSFRKLKNLKVERCPNLEILCPLSVAAALEQLDILDVIGNLNLKEIIAKEIGDMKNNDTEMIIFPKLRNIHLLFLPNLKCFFGGSVRLVFPSLESIHCFNLREMVTFVSSENPGDLDALFNNKVALPAIKHIKMSLVDGLQKIWGSHVDVRSFNELESLDIKFVEKATKAFSLDAIQRIRNLKELNLQQFQLTEQFIERVGFYNDEVENSVLLPQLRNLKLDSFPQLKRIPWRELALQNLRCLQISEIHDLTYLFPASVCKRLVNLEALRVHDCHKMKEIVREELGDTNTVEVKVVFPHLNFLRLNNLPAFQSLGSDNIILEFPSIKEVDFDKFQNPILWDLLQKLKPVKELQLGRCESLFELHDLKGRSSTMLPRLRNLTLSYMDNLQRIPWMIFPIKNLRYLKISYIHGLKFLFTASMCSEGFAQLEEIHIQDCKDIEQMLAQESIEDTSNNAAPITVVLPRLKIIKLYYLRSLRSFSSENYEALEFPSLEEVEIKECPMMKTFSSRSLSNPRLCKINTN